MPTADAVQLRLRAPGPEDEAQMRAAHDELGREGFVFCLGLTPAMSWARYLRWLGDAGHPDRVPEGWVPSTFLVAEVGRNIVGRTSIRHQLNEFLAREGGHIGYAVRPAFRRRGFASVILGQSLVAARGLGIERALLTCDDTNAASAAVIEGCGGVLDGIVAADGTSVRRYWVGPPG